MLERITEYDGPLRACVCVCVCGVDRYREAVEGLIQAERVGAKKDIVLERLQTMLISLILQEKPLTGDALKELERTQVEYRIRLDNRGNDPSSDLPRVDGLVIPRARDYATTLIDDEKIVPYLALLQQGLSLPQVIMAFKPESLRELIIVGCRSLETSPTLRNILPATDGF